MSYNNSRLVRQANEIDRLTQQRDELLAALKRLSDFIGGMECEPEFDLYATLKQHYDDTQELIAKAEADK